MMISWPKLIILLVIAVLVLGTDRLRSLGSDLGAAIKGFKKEMNEGDKKTPLIDNKDASNNIEHD